MKKLIVLFATVFAFALQAQWTRVYDDKQTNSGIQRNGNTFFWFEGNKLFSSSHGFIAEMAGSGSYAFSMSFSDENNGLLTLGYHVNFRYVTEFYETSNGGKSWTKVLNPVPAVKNSAWESSYLLQLSLEKWLCKGNSETWYSPNNGQEWTQLSVNGDSAYAFAYSDASDEIILHSSNNNGWFSPNESQLLVRFNLLHKTADTFFLDDLKSLYDDSDLASYWVFDKIVKTISGSWYLLFHEFIPSCGAMYNRSVLCYSDDNGKTWKKIKFKLDPEHYVAPNHLVFSGNDTAYLTSSDRVYRSTDGGMNWKQFTRGIHADEKNHSNITGMFLVGDILFVTTQKASLMAHSALHTDAVLQQKKIETFALSAYPNPAQSGDIIYLNIPNSSSANMQFRLCKPGGTLVAQGPLAQEGCSLKELSPGSYILSIEEKNTIILKQQLIILQK